MSKFNLACGKVTDLKLEFNASEDKFKFEFMLDGLRCLGVSRSAYVPLSDGDEIALIYELVRGKALAHGIKNLALGGQIWQRQSASLLFATLFLVICIASCIVGGEAAMDTIASGSELLVAALPIFVMAIPAALAFRQARQVLMCRKIKHDLHAVPGASCAHGLNGEIIGVVSNLRFTPDGDSVHFGFVISGVFICGTADKKSNLALKNGDRVKVEYDDFTALKIINLTQNSQWGSGVVRRNATAVAVWLWSLCKANIKWITAIFALFYAGGLIGGDIGDMMTLAGAIMFILFLL